MGRARDWIGGLYRMVSFVVPIGLTDRKGDVS